MQTIKATYALTYNKGRKCKHCNEPISDQAHKKREFCETEVGEDGTIKSCHDDYHSERRAEKEAGYRSEAAYQKGVHLALHSLYQVIGSNEVTLERLNSLGIDLERPLRKQAKEDGLYNFFFYGFRLEQQTLYTFKIYPL